MESVFPLEEVLVGQHVRRAPSVTAMGVGGAQVVMHRILQISMALTLSLSPMRVEEAMEVATADLCIRRTGTRRRTSWG